MQLQEERVGAVLTWRVPCGFQQGRGDEHSWELNHPTQHAASDAEGMYAFDCSA